MPETDLTMNVTINTAGSHLGGGLGVVSRRSEHVRERRGERREHARPEALHHPMQVHQRTAGVWV